MKAYIVVENTNDGGWILSRNLKAFLQYEAAKKCVDELERTNDDIDVRYTIEEIEVF